MNQAHNKATRASSLKTASKPNRASKGSRVSKGNRVNRDNKASKDNRASKDGRTNNLKVSGPNNKVSKDGKGNRGGEDHKRNKVRTTKVNRASRASRARVNKVSKVNRARRASKANRVSKVSKVSKANSLVASRQAAVSPRASEASVTSKAAPSLLRPRRDPWQVAALPRGHHRQARPLQVRTATSRMSFVRGSPILKNCAGCWNLTATFQDKPDRLRT